VPELPEVETIIRRLRNGAKAQLPVAGQVIYSVDITWDRSIARPNPEAFMANLQGKTILDARRRGKYLHFPLSAGHLIGHLRMSGDMRMEPRINADGTPYPPEDYDRVLINFASNWRLVFSNIRKFGRLWYVKDPQEVFGGLGPEPLSPNFSADKLYNMLQTHSQQIKPLLMDQHFLAGLGNIYTDESLFNARIHPLRQSNSLSKSEAQELFHAIQDTLREGIHRFGASLDWIYRGGEYQNAFRVYQREGEKCDRCGSSIQKITVGQRGTHFCPYCQVLPEAA